MTFEHDESMECGVNIKVIGVGGGGNNAVNRMVESGVKGVEFIGVNTDRQALKKSSIPNQVQIGERITKGLGAGANPAMGERAAEESIDDLKSVLNGADMVFVTAGMGGGTGTGAAPVVARVARELGILTIGVVTKPFSFELKKRMKQAEEGIAELSQYVDSLIVIPNDRLRLITNTKITLANAFGIADDVLRSGVQSISDLLTETAHINLDFADVKRVMESAGYAHMGVGYGAGKDKAEEAARAAIASPLLETSIKGATRILISITASPDLGLEEAAVATELIGEEGHPDADIIWGVSFDESLEDEMRITIVATGFEKGDDTPKKVEHKPAPAPTPSTKATLSNDLDDLLGGFGSFKG
ncbi:MAG: cell division protein FtsZ [Clostridia bacterium]|nr:cell division protein FtsZ [Clostridia bacterium]